ncbi:MAG: AsmA-like C-terminal region-containing protein, partial [Planctomycetota bacterium]
MAFALIVSAIIFTVQFIVPQTVGEQIRRHVETVLREHYPDYRVSIGRGRFDPKVGLIFEGITFQQPDTSAEASGMFGRPFRDVLEVRQVVIATSTKLERLLDKEMPLVPERIIVSGIKAEVDVDSNGKVSLSQLWPLPEFGDSKEPCPRIEIRDATIAVTESTQEKPFEFSIDEAVVLTRTTSPTASAQPPSTTIAATAGCSFADEIRLHLEHASDRINFRARFSGAEYSQDVLKRIPAQFRALADGMGDLELSFDLGIDVTVGPDQPIEFAAKAEIKDGRFRHPQSSIPLKDIRGLLVCDTAGLDVKSLDATWGEARLAMRSNRPATYSWPANASFVFSANNVLLDQRLEEVIPPELRQVWNKFEPRGMIDVTDGTLDVIGGKLDVGCDVTCKGVDISFERFPYPVQSMAGKIEIRNKRVRSQRMSGWIGGRLMNCMFDMPSKVDPRAEKYFSVTVDGPIAINNELLSALTPRGEPITPVESFMRSLRPLGAVHLENATFRTDREGMRHQTAQFTVSDGSLRFEKFPYPLYNVAGRVQIEDDTVTLSQFLGSNANGGVIACDGVYHIPNRNNPWIASNNAGKQMLSLNFDARRVALDESLRSSLPIPSRRTWDSLWPSGVLDSLKIGLEIAEPKAPLELTLVGQQFDSGTLGNDALRLQPASVPYRMDIVDGAVRYQNGKVLIDSLRAQHGLSRVSADGGCEQLPNGRWLLTMNLHSGSRLIPDSELIQSLPEQMRGAMRGLNLRGPVGLSGLTRTMLATEREPEPVFIWDLDLQLEGNRIGDVGPVHALRGELSVKGGRDASGIHAHGEVQIDSMHVNDLQITQIRGPYQIVDDKLILGQNVAPRGSAPLPIQGNLFDGRCLLNGNVKLSDASFDVRMGVHQAKVPALLAELGHGKSDLTGSLNAQLALEGLLGTTELLSGRGRATVEDANLYELPILYQLLNVLSVTPNEDVAFTNGDVTFTLEEDETRFDDVKLWGSLIALHGQGSLDRRRELDLTFNTRVSPRNTFTRIIRPLGDQRFTL